MKKFQDGFSLVELLVVVAIIGVLAGVGTVGYQSYVDSTRAKVSEQNWKTVIKTLEFEQIVVQNFLGSAIKEKDKDGNWIDEDGNTTSDETEARAIMADTPCLNFLHSIKEHFKEFRNPYITGDLGLTKVAITVDTQGQTHHKKGQIHLTCYKQNASFGDGSGCPIPKARIHAIVYFENKGRWHYSDGTCGDDCVKVYTLGGSIISGAAEAQADCGWDSSIHGPWTVTNNINSNADY